MTFCFNKNIADCKAVTILALQSETKLIYVKKWQFPLLVP